MSGFIRSISIEAGSGADVVTFTTTPMSYTAFLRFRTLAEHEGEKAFGSGDSERALIEEFTQAVTAVSGSDAAGAALTKDDVFGAAYFARIVAEASLKWLERSIPQGNG